MAEGPAPPPGLLCMAGGENSKYSRCYEYSPGENGAQEQPEQQRLLCLEPSWLPAGSCWQK